MSRGCGSALSVVGDRGSADRGLTKTINSRTAFWDTLGPCSPWAKLPIPARSTANANDFALSLELADGTDKATVVWNRTLRYRIRVSGVNDSSVLVAHFVNRLVFCMFAEDVGLLPDNMFTRMLEHSRKRPDEFTDLSRDLFGAMASGGRIGFEAVAWFNGGLFDDDETLPLEREEIDVAIKAAALDWSEIDPSIFGTLFERGLDPDKRSQLGAHYTDREKIMLIVEPVIIPGRIGALSFRPV